MNLAAALDTLRTKGKANTAKIYARHGVREPSFGVSYADLAGLVKEIGVDHELALALWKSGNHDARVLATKIADPDVMATSAIKTWIRQARNYVIADAVSALAARMPGASALAAGWMADPGEWTSAAGWNVITVLAMNGELDDKHSRALLARIRKHLHRAPNRTRYAMNNALIALGARPEMRDEALEVARAIGPVEVEHGETGCKTPDAAAYIQKMATRRTAKRTRVTGARPSAPARRR